MAHIPPKERAPGNAAPAPGAWPFRVHLQGVWKFREHINIGELRTAVMHLRWLVRQAWAHGFRHVLLLDSKVALF